MTAYSFSMNRHWRAQQKGNNSSATQTDALSLGVASRTVIMKFAPEQPAERSCTMQRTSRHNMTNPLITNRAVKAGNQRRKTVPNDTSERRAAENSQTSGTRCELRPANKQVAISELLSTQQFILRCAQSDVYRLWAIR